MKVSKINIVASYLTSKGVSEKSYLVHEEGCERVVLCTVVLFLVVDSALSVLY